MKTILGLDVDDDRHGDSQTFISLPTILRSQMPGLRVQLAYGNSKH